MRLLFWPFWYAAVFVNSLLVGFGVAFIYEHYIRPLIRRNPPDRTLFKEGPTFKVGDVVEIDGVKRVASYAYPKPKRKASRRMR